MYKSKLPFNCPPSDVEQQEMSLYRLMIPDDLIESFKNHVDLYPDNISYKTDCKTYAVSFFDNIDMVKKLLTKENNEGKIIAKVNIKMEYGVLSKKPSKTGHFNLWLFNNFNPNEVTFELINI
jgi:hypothetical protein